MKLKRLGGLGTAIVLSISALLSITFSGTVLALAPPYTCTWTGGGDGTSLNETSNWSGCNGSSPQPNDNDNLVFNAMTTSLALNNNITSLNVGNITISGAYTGQLNINGNPFSMSGGITDTATGSGLDNLIASNITLTANQTFDVSASQDYLTLHNINLGTNNLTVNAGQVTNNSIYLSSLSGSGGLTFSGSGSEASFNDADASYSGPVTIGNGASVEISTFMNALGTGPITVNDGGTLMVEDSASTDTLANALTLSGSGQSSSTGGALLSCLGWVSPSSGGPGNGQFGALTGCTTDGTTLTLSGALSLDANATVVNAAYLGTTPTNSATFDFTGNITQNGFTLTGDPSSNTTVSPTSLTSSGSSSNVAAPKTPDTGSGLILSDYWLPLIGSVMIAGCIYFISRKFKHAIVTERH